MPKIFPCYSASDRELARELAALLESGCGVEVLLEEGEAAPGGDLIAKVEEGLAADVVLVLLSPASVPPRWPLERWQSVFWEQAAEVGTAVATLLCEDCKFPALLKRNNFFDLRQNRIDGFRATRRWLMKLWPAAQQAPFVPARLPSFTGRDAELEALCTLLGDAPGMVAVNAPAGYGKTALALEFARRCRDDFAAVLWLTCGARTTAALSGDLAAQLGTRLDRDLESNLHELRCLCARHRCLLVLDDAVAATAPALAPRGCSSVLLTTRDAALAAALSATPLHLDAPPQLDAALDEALRRLDPAAQRLLAAMCACAPSGFRLDLAQRMAGISITPDFLSHGFLAPLDENGPRYLIPAAVREAVAVLATDECWPLSHALALAESFGDAHWTDLQAALAWALAEPDEWDLAGTLARRGVAWAKAQDRLAEAFEMLQGWSRAATKRKDRRVLEECAWEQMWILERWGRDEEARELENVRRRHYANQLSLDFGDSL